MAAQTYPVTLVGELTIPPARGWWLIKWLLALPHYIILAFLWVAFIIVWLIALFAILFTGRFPRGLFDFNVGVLRWTWRVGFYSYEALATDKYPPFTLKSVDYPADLQVEYPEKLSKGLVLVKWWLLAIPHYIIVAIFNGWGGKDGGFPGLIYVLAIIAAVVLLFTGKYPESIFKLVIGVNRWSYRFCTLRGVDDRPVPALQALGRLGSRLAPGAEIGAAIAHRDALNRGAAVGAVFAATVRNLELKVGGAGLTAGPVVIYDAGALITYGGVQCPLNGVIKMFDLFQCQTASRPQWINFSGKQGFIGVHIADAGNYRLVAE